MVNQPLRFSIGDLLLATMLTALPLAFQTWIGWPAALSLSIMALALTFGYGTLALTLMCVALVTSANVDATLGTLRSPLGSLCTSVAIIVVIALVLRFQPVRPL